MEKEIMNKYKRAPEKYFGIFKKECEYWIEYFGLKSCSIKIGKDESKESTSRAYTCRTRPTHHRLFAIYICMWQEDGSINTFDEEMVREIAFHEVCEVLLYDVSDLIACSEGNNNAFNNVHEIIRTLENTVFRDSYQRRFKK